jgi:hypothetical protein
LGEVTVLMRGAHKRAAHQFANTARAVHMAMHLSGTDLNAALADVLGESRSIPPEHLAEALTLSTARLPKVTLAEALKGMPDV